MATVSVLNTDVQLSASELIDADDAQTITGAKTFDRDPSAPFAVTSSSAVVTNLDADKLDGVEGASFLRSDAADTKNTGDLTFDDNIKVTLGTGGDADLSYDGTDVVFDTAVVGSGELVLTQGKINFPNTQVASADANTLDDYEEGTWTPVIGGSGGTSGQSYTSQVGTYTKIGRLVTCSFRVILSAKGTITANVEIQGLPFTAASTALNQPNAVFWDVLGTNHVYVITLMQLSDTAALVLGTKAAATDSNDKLQAADIADTTTLSGVITYEV